MPYTRSLEIERRLSQLLILIERGEHSAPALAKALGVSIPTVSRCITALRERGHHIRAEKHGNGWRYVVPRKTGPRNAASRRSRRRTGQRFRA